MRIVPALALILCIATCQALIQLNGQYGEFESPGYPAPYPDNEDITWQITTDPGYEVVVYFTIFDLEDSYDDTMGGACVYDYLKIEYPGTTIKYCGNYRQYPGDAIRPQQRLRSKGNVMTIRFVTDYSNEDPRPVGFKAHYVIEDANECAQMANKVKNTVEDWDELVYCNHFCINVPGSYYCTCRPGFELHENLHTCKASCEHQALTDETGVITSADYPHTYSRLTDCDWTIQVREGMSLNILFDLVFDIEKHFDYTECVYDWLKISIDGQETKYCGEEAPYSGLLHSTNVREIRIDFHTDNAIEKTGFKMTYNTTKIRCLEEPHDPSNGTITNPKGYYEYEDQILFECNPGYSLIGEKMITCQNNGHWDYPYPICQIKSCGLPTDLINVPYATAVYGNISFTYRDEVKVQCNTWYKMVSGESRWWCSEDATWQPRSPLSNVNFSNIPVCKAECGKKNGGDRPFFGLHISGGTVARRHEWPWMAFINFGVTPNVGANFYTCGAALISPQYVLTAAHCVTGNRAVYPPEGVKWSNITHVWLGAHDRAEDRRDTSARAVPVAKIIRHPDYNRASLWDSDIALIKLAETIVMSDIVRPICIPTRAQDFNLLMPGELNSSGEVAGWGIHDAQRRLSVVLRNTVLPTVTKATCWKSFKDAASITEGHSLPRGLSLTENMFCAGFHTGSSSSTCDGDSGSAFMVENSSTKEYYEVGLVSFGLAQTLCGDSVSYSGFAKITPAISQWILQNSDLN